MPSNEPSGQSPRLPHIFHAWIDGWNRLGLDRTHTVPRTEGYVMLALSLPTGLLMNHLARQAQETADPGLLVSLAAGYVAGLNQLAEEPMGTGLAGAFWTGMAVLLPLWLIARGLFLLGTLVSRR